MDAFGISNLDNPHPILDQLVYIVDKVQAKGIGTNDKLMQWSKRRFDHKFLVKVSHEIVNGQENIFKLVT